MSEQDCTAVIGAGVIGGATAFALAREGRKVLLFDRAAPGEGGASFGNAGHVATELVAPLPSPALLFGFWRQLFAWGGALHIPLRRLGAFTPWALRFGRAAFQRRAHTAVLAPFVRPAVPALLRLLTDAGRADLIRQRGHYQVWMKGRVDRLASAEARAMAALDVHTEPAAADVLQRVRDAARADRIAGLWYPRCAHVLDPLEAVRSLSAAATQLGARMIRQEVRALRAVPGGCEVVTAGGNTPVRNVVVCAGVWSAPLLTPFDLKVPLEAARGYHVRMPGTTPFADAPLLYSDHDIVVTPMAGHVRATGFMEFAGSDAPADPRKPAWLRATVRSLGYHCEDGCGTWVGSRPVLPDYLPAIGRARSVPWLYYAFAHQHIGLTLAGMTAFAVADLMAGRPRPDLQAFDLGRFH